MPIWVASDYLSGIKFGFAQMFIWGRHQRRHQASVVILIILYMISKANAVQ
jgi:hypothetical protein